MGLDSYAYKATKSLDGMNSYPIEIAYWRKHNVLHNWMKTLYRQYGFTDEFNCEKVELTKEHLLRLKADIINCNLIPTTGFFFGNTDYMNNYKGSNCQKYDLEFVNNALELLETEKDTIIYYYSSW